MKQFILQGEYITLGQLLKNEGIINSGGEAKLFLASNSVLVNGVVTTERGKKLRDNDVVIIKTINFGLKVISTDV